MRLAGFAFLIATATSVLADCDPTTEPDRSDIGNARAAVAANCDCAGSTRRDYLRCATEQIDAVIVNRGCRGRARSCEAKSTCGKPGRVTCCRTKNGVTKCKTARDPESCLRHDGTAGACTSCCDACPAPGDGPSCPGHTSTTSTTLMKCCVPSVACGPFDTCTETSGACSGYHMGPGSCSDDPLVCTRVTTTTLPQVACCVAGECQTANLCTCTAILGGRPLFFGSCVQVDCSTTTTTTTVP
jgi:hypothetical protein